MSTVLLTCSGIFYNSNSILIGDITWKKGGIFILIIGIAVYLASFLFENKESENIKKIIEDNKALNQNNQALKRDNINIEQKIEYIESDYYRLCSNILRNSFSQNFFDLTDNNGRISLYKHESDKFVLLGRYSNNPTYNEKGRGNYSSKEGFISLGWEKKEFKIDGIPEYTNKGSDYINHIRNNCNINSGTISKMRMRSRSYYVYRFDNEDSRKPLGIIVFEKLSSNSIDTDIINKQEEIKDIISSLLKGMKNIK